MIFCQQLPINIKLLNETLIQNATKYNITLNEYMHTTLNQSNKSIEQTKQYTLHGDLISIHSPVMIHLIMNWILSLEPRQFWIGGLIKLIVHQFNNEDKHVIQTWTDHTPVTVRFLHHHNNVLENLKPNDIACLSIDYASGKWGVHYCTETKYFLCELIKIPNRRIKLQKTLTNETKQQSIHSNNNNTMKISNGTMNSTHIPTSRHKLLIINLHNNNNNNHLNHTQHNETNINLPLNIRGNSTHSTITTTTTTTTTTPITTMSISTVMTMQLM
uniref:Clone ZZD1354 mRNA sequence n=1 Tax=Schistosoma japonicum TaxID=6182 RepID=Q86EW5_SCHJA|nr:hypothetical protein [Schistosoma japonicum]